MAKLSPFRKAILTALANIPNGYTQRIDGLRCERGIIERDWPFFGIRLYLMERAGLVRSKPTPSFWPSCDGMPSYSITDAGRAALGTTPPQTREVGTE